MPNSQTFHRGVPTHERSRIIRRGSAQDVRLTPSDRAHDLIMQKAEEEHERIKNEDKEEHIRKKFGSNLWKLPGAPPRTDFIASPIPPPPTADLSAEQMPVRPRSRASAEQPSRRTVDKPVVQPRKTAVDKSPEKPGKKAIKRPGRKPAGKSTQKGKKGHRDKAKKKNVRPTSKKFKTRVAPEAVDKQGSIQSIHQELRPSIGIPGQVMDSQRRKSVATQNKRVSIVATPRIKHTPSSTTNIYHSTMPPAGSVMNTIWVEEAAKRTEHERQSLEKGEIKMHRQNVVTADLHGELEHIKKHLEGYDEEEEYHPYAHRKYHHEIKNWQSISLLIRAIMAGGILKTPMLFSVIGSYNGVMGIVLIIIWISCTLHVFFNARLTMCKILRRPYLGFGEFFREAMLIGPHLSRRFANCMGTTVEFLLVYHQITVLIKYNNFLACYSLMTFARVSRSISHAIHLLPVMTVCIFLMFINSLKKLAVLSLIGNILVCFQVAMVLFQLTGSLSGSTKPNPPIKHTYPTFYFIGQGVTITDCLGAVIVIEKHMKHPKVITGWSGVINLSLMFALIWYIMVGFFGIYQFGMTVDYHYLLDLDLNRNWNIGLYVMYALAMTFSFCIHAYFVVESLWTAGAKTNMAASKYLRGWRALTRTSIAVLPFFIMYMPNLLKHCVLSVGYFLGPFLVLACPAIMHFCVSWHKKCLTISKLYLFLDIVLIALAIVASIGVALYYRHALRFNYIFGEFA